MKVYYTVVHIQVILCLFQKKSKTVKGRGSIVFVPEKVKYTPMGFIVFVKMKVKDTHHLLYLFNRKSQTYRG